MYECNISTDSSAAPVSAVGESSAGPTVDVRRSISPTQPDRSCNLVISGVAEDRDPAIWRDTVTRVLALAAGRDVRIGDAFRLGRFDERRNRPILVKLMSAWDRRVILSGAHKLSGDHHRRLVVFDLARLFVASHR